MALSGTTITVTRLNSSVIIAHFRNAEELGSHESLYKPGANFEMLSHECGSLPTRCFVLYITMCSAVHYILQCFSTIL